MLVKEPVFHAYVEITRDARKKLSRLPTQMQTRIAKAVLSLESDPFPHGCKKLKNCDGYRIRVGVIGHRREIYRDWKLKFQSQPRRR